MVAAREPVVFLLALISSLICIAICLPASSFRQKVEAGCGYKSCNPVKDGMINVHLVPHTHDDVGWLKTVDQYYYGNKNYIQFAEVQFILDSVIQELWNDPAKRFIYVEIAFFSRWWREQDNSTQHKVNALVQEGRLEFILGGWCMNDEASTHYNDIIDQHHIGFEFLRQNFGQCARPRVAWQIDPFGHSREQASLFAQMGFDGLFFGRLDYQDKEKRLNNKTMELVWQGSPVNLGMKSDLFTGALYNGYGPPGGFCFDIFCNDDMISDDPRLHDYNKDQKVKDFLSAVNDQAQHYATNHIVMTMGSDFQYTNAHTWYKNLDKLIRYVNELQMNGSKVNLLYSTPSCYLYQLNQANLTWTTKQDDFFPYAHRPHSFWTGYFTSRAALKYYVRRSNNFLQVAKQLDALALMGSNSSSVRLWELKEAMGVAQHHDAVSGTEKQAVAYDYALRLSDGVGQAEMVINDAFQVILPKFSTKPPMLQFCHLQNISVCLTTQAANQFQVHIYNPLSQQINHYIRIPVTGKAYSVTGPNGETIINQVSPVSKDTFRIPERGSAITNSELLFEAKNLPPLGHNTYFIQGISDPESVEAYVTPKQLNAGADTTLTNGLISLVIDGTSGKLKSLSNLVSGVTTSLTQDIEFYVGHPGDNSRPEVQASGAYVFRPNSTSSYKLDGILRHTSAVRSYVAQGQLVQEVYQEFEPYASQVVRLYQGRMHVEVQWTVGPIPGSDNIGRELITRYTTNLDNQGIFYTDANGREILKRVRNHRDTWDLNQTEPVAGNYYPVNSRIFLQDVAKGTQFTVLTDRSEGGSSLTDGSLELMLHRRLFYDDSLGVGEPLNEKGSDGNGLVVRGRHYLLLETIAKSAAFHRQIATHLYLSPLVTFTTAVTTQSAWSQLYHTTSSGLQMALPDNIHLLTLERFPRSGPLPTSEAPYLIRLEHIFEKGEDANFSNPVTLDLRKIFAPFNVSAVSELTLGGNFPLRELKRLSWKTVPTHTKVKEDRNKETLLFRPVADPFMITLMPMEIRTFQVDVKKW